jgi:bacteriocin biosynthesis cyclodehydratase domain-containing protein
MIQRRDFLLGAIAGSILATQVRADFVPDNEIKTILKDWIDNARGQASLAYKLNRACLAAGTPWITCDTSAAEIVVGPLVVPGRTACHLCYKMRLVAGSQTPEDEFTFQSFLDRRKRDDSRHRQNLVFAAGLGAQLVALEAFKQLSSVLPPVTRGRVLVFDTLQLTSTLHVVLRKPWCPACSVAAEPVSHAG